MNIKSKKIRMTDYDAVVFKTKKYTTVHLNFLFEIPFTKKNTLLFDLIANYVYYTNGLYKTTKEIKNKLRELYSIYYDITSYNVGQKQFFQFSFSMVDPEKVGDDYTEDAIKFMRDVMFKPNFQYGKLDDGTVERIKNIMINSFAEDLKDPDSICERAFKKEYYSGTYECTDYIETKEEYENLINSITDREIIDAYTKLVEENFVMLTIMGNIRDIDLDRIRSIIKFKNVKKLDTDYKKDFEIDTSKNVHLKNEYISESNVKVLYDIKNYSKRDKYAFEVISMILNYDVGCLLHEVLRDKRGLTYFSNATFDKRGKLLIINANISRENKDAVIKAIDEVIDMIKSKTVIEKFLQKSKEKVDYNEYMLDENKRNIDGRLVSESCKFRIKSSTRIKNIKSLKVEDITSASNKLERSGVFFYEGTKK